MQQSISASRIATLLGSFDRSPAYAGLAEALRDAIGDGRIPLDVRLPSERELPGVLGVSRTTVSRAYGQLREQGYGVARTGAGTFTRVPGGRARAHDRALLPRPGDTEAIDLNCAAPAAPPGLAEAYVEATADLPAYLGGHGYFPTGLPVLREALADDYAARGLPTDPGQILVTSGAVSAAAIVAHALLGPGDRALVENPVWPNAVLTLRQAGARVLPTPVDAGGWDLDATGAALRQAAPRTAYLIPDFQNPTGLLMDDEQRATCAGLLRRTGTTPVVDEVHHTLLLDDEVAKPRPFAAHHPGTLTIGGSSKGHWGGLRLGWVRAPRELVDRLTRARLGVDLGAPVLEQLVMTRLLRERPEVAAAHRARLREQRDRLAAAVCAQLPDWRFRLPAGGLALWLELPEAAATAVATAADARGLIVAPGPVFALEGGLDRFLRIPWTRPPEELEEAVRRVAEAWSEVAARGSGRGAGGVRAGGPVLVA